MHRIGITAVLPATGPVLENFLDQVGHAAVGVAPRPEVESRIQRSSRPMADSGYLFQGLWALDFGLCFSPPSSVLCPLSSSQAGSQPQIPPDRLQHMLPRPGGAGVAHGDRLVPLQGAHTGGHAAVAPPIAAADNVAGAGTGNFHRMPLEEGAA